MRILHYSLGLPPFRSGGMTKFCLDLMKQQIKEGHTVILLWPGRMTFFSSKVSIHKPIITYNDGAAIRNYELINPLPISYDEGINNIEAFTNDCSPDVFFDFLNECKPDIIHIHTLMGLYNSFLIAAKKENIQLVYTAHDFFPICPKVTMFRNGRICNSVKTCEECESCNNTALTLSKIRMLQSVPYQKLKESRLVKLIRKNHRDHYLNDEDQKEVVNRKAHADYKQLRRYYLSMLEKFDIIHYNSSLTREIYDQYDGNLIGRVIPITHGDIENHKHLKNFNDEKIRIRYLGPFSKGKGFFILKEALDKLWRERQNFCLDIHFVSPIKAPYIIQHERYQYSELESIFDKTDVLIVPSVWYETFGFTVAEALSYGVPVIVTETVGSKDILAEGAGLVVNSENLYKALKTLNANTLCLMNKAIVEKQHILTINEMVKLINEECYLFPKE